jgi:acetoin utilization protein AcuC
MRAAILFNEELRGYDFGEGHPYRGDRYDGFIHLFNEKLRDNPIFTLIEPMYATDEDLLLVHDREYVDFVQAASRGIWLPGIPTSRFASADNLSPRTGTLPLNIDRGARLIVGTSKLAGELAWKGEYDVAIGIGGRSAPRQTAVWGGILHLQRCCYLRSQSH